jgi:hypothetical protein
MECSTKLRNRALPLLPSMIACIRRTQSQNTAEIIQPDYESMVGETFCVAWFHPGGVQEVDVALNVKDDVYVAELGDAFPTNISSQSRTQLKRDIDAPSRRDEVESQIVHNQGPPSMLPIRKDTLFVLLSGKAIVTLYQFYSLLDIPRASSWMFFAWRCKRTMLKMLAF